LKLPRHRIRRPWLLAGLFAAALLALPSVALADDDGQARAQAMLAESDRLTNHYATQFWRFRMTVATPGSEARVLEFRVWQKDQRQRLVRFDAPGPVKGMAMLSQGRNVMYVYSPQTDNVRRVAAHAERQTLLGSNLTYSDMSTVDLADSWDATFDEETPTHQWLALSPKDGASTMWSALRVRVDKETRMVDTTEYFDDGKKARVQTFSDFGELEGVPTYQKVEMRSLDSGVVTTLEMLEQKIGLDLDDGMFRQRSLVRGR